jgi:hypothetical protein
MKEDRKEINKQEKIWKETKKIKKYASGKISSSKT